MKQVLKTYQLELKVRGPVFIGSGSEIQKKEYVFMKDDTVGIVDPAKLYFLAKKRHLESDFERFMTKDTKEALQQWIIRNHIPGNELVNCFQYRVNVGDIERDKGRMQIMSCVKDPYGFPYIPGSSIKGMLRTILLCAKLMKNPERYRMDIRQILEDLQDTRKIGRNRVLMQNVRNLETKAFHTLKRSEKQGDAVNDVMAGIIISDSEPLSCRDLILCQKWEHHVDGSCKTLNLLRECIKPGTVIKATVTVDERLCTLTAQEIMEAIQLFYDRYYEVFQRKFKKTDRCAPNTVFLGGGAGFVSKTVVYSLFGDREGVSATQQIFQKTGVPREHKHVQDTRLGVSPHILKCTRYQGKEYLMGQCEITLK